MDGSSVALHRADCAMVQRSEEALVIVMVGRSNYRKHSTLVRSLADDLAVSGIKVLMFDTLEQRTGLFLDALLASSPFGALSGKDGLAGFVRRLVRGALILVHPSRWAYFVYVLRGRQKSAAWELRAFVRKSGSRNVYLFGHSAGSILAMTVEDEPTVRGQISFGHPFRHPEREEEPYRTERLATRQKPLLIIQGHRDIYGSPAMAARYPLSPSVRLFPLDAAHDYRDPGEADYALIHALVAEFLGLPVQARHSVATPVS